MSQRELRQEVIRIKDARHRAVQEPAIRVRVILVKQRRDCADSPGQRHLDRLAQSVCVDYHPARRAVADRDNALPSYVIIDHGHQRYCGRVIRL